MMPKTKLETFKARERRVREGFFLKYCKGKGLDIGYGGDLLALNCIGYDLENGDAQHLSEIRPESYDFVYSSHLLEHMRALKVALKVWFKAVKPGGYFILYVPERDLYEKKKRLPSRWNSGHYYFFLLEHDDPPDTIGLLPFIALSLSGYKLIYAKVCDEGHTITDPKQHSNGEYSIEVVLKKVKK